MATSGSSVRRHPRFYYPDGSDVVLVAGEVLFRIHRGVLAEHSDVLASMFSMPQDPLSDEPREGSSDEHPIRLESDVVTVREFERIMFFILGTHLWSPNATYEQEMLLDILRVGSRWEMNGARNFAIYHLQKLWLEPAQQIELAAFYNIQHWLAPAFASLVRTTWVGITDDSAVNLPGRILLIIARTKDMITRERSLLALNVPRLSITGSSSCSNHANCRTAWHDTWTRKVRAAMLHPDNPLRFDKAQEFLRNLSFPGMTPQCLTHELDRIFSPNGPFCAEDRIIAQGTRVLQDWCRLNSRFSHLEQPETEINMFASTPPSTHLTDLMDDTDDNNNAFDIDWTPLQD